MAPEITAAVEALERCRRWWLSVVDELDELVADEWAYRDVLTNAGPAWDQLQIALVTLFKDKASYETARQAAQSRGARYRSKLLYLFLRAYFREQPTLRTYHDALRRFYEGDLVSLYLSV